MNDSELESIKKMYKQAYKYYALGGKQDFSYGLVCAYENVLMYFNVTYAELTQIKESVMDD